MSVFPQLTEKKQTYVIGEVIVSGKTTFSPQTIVTYSGLRKGEEITLPGQKISNAIKKIESLTHVEGKVHAIRVLKTDDK